MTKENFKISSIKFAAALLAVLAGIIISSVIIILSGYNPLIAFQAIADQTFGSATNFGNWIQMSVPLMFTGLSLSFAYKVGLFNIGAEGQFMIATFVTSYVAGQVHGPAIYCVIVSLLAGTLSGAFLALIPGLLKAYYGVSEVVVTIMLNWVVFYYVNYLIENVYHLADKNNQTPNISDSASLNCEFLQNITNGSTLNIGFFIAIGALILYWFMINKTTLGFEVQAVGGSPYAAKYAGVKEKRKLWYAMTIAGAFAGLGGAVSALSDPGYITTISTFRNFGFDGIAVAMLGQLSSIGVFLSSLLFGALRAASVSMYPIPKEIVDIMIGVTIITSSLGTVLTIKYLKRGDK